MPSRSWASAASAALAAMLVVAGCAGGGEAAEDATLRVYVSLPLRGPSGVDGRNAADGARLALADAGGEAGGFAVETVFLDDTEDDGNDVRWSPAKAAANAREATQDSTTVAYLGEFESGATRASLPVTNEARLLQVSPASAAVDLVAPFRGSDDVPDAQPSGERSFGRVVPSDPAQAQAAARWAERIGARRISTLSDRSDFGEGMIAAFEETLERATLTRRNGDLLFYGGEPDRQPASLIETFDGTTMVSDAELASGALAAQEPGTLATSAALDPSQLPPAGQDFAERFDAEHGRRPGRYAAYGYEAMAVILDSIERASDPADRAAVIDAFFETTDRDSVLGTYSIDELGDTTLGEMTGYELGRGMRAKPVAEISATP